jgi:hypothetical protein
MTSFFEMERIVFNLPCISKVLAPAFNSLRGCSVILEPDLIEGE